MVFLIGGPPRCGKTTLAETLAKKTSLPCFALDHVSSVIFPFIPEENYPDKLPLYVARRETNYCNDAFYKKYKTEEIVGFYLRQAETYWPGIAGFIKYAVEDKHDLILEGWQLLPHLLHPIAVEYQEQVKVNILYKLDAKKINPGLKASTAKNDWVIRNTKDENTFAQIAQMISTFGRKIEQESQKYNLTATNTESDFYLKLEDAMRAWS